MPESVSVVHVISSLHPRAGGPSRTVVQLADSLAAHPGCHVALLSQGAAGEPSVPSTHSAVDRCVVETSSRVALRLALPIRTHLERMARDRGVTLIHNHGLWAPANHWACATARRHGIPLVTHPRGMLEPWALKHRAWKKRIAMPLFQRADLEAAAILVATSEVECENMRRLGLRNPVAVIPNGVKLDASRVDSRTSHDHAVGQRTVLFLSRVHPVKGLPNLMIAWRQLSPDNWRLQIAGPDEGGHLQEVQALVQQLGIRGSVDFLGEVEGARKAALFADADLFVLPTYTESFGVAVAEALAHGVPVITTRGAPWSDLEVHDCGWWVEIGVEPLVQALREAMSLSAGERQAMGARGRKYVQRFDWEVIAQQTIAVYRWVLGQGHQPECVRTG